MSDKLPSITALTNEFARLPGIGRKSAQRLAYFIVNQDTHRVTSLAKALIEVKQKVRYCQNCFNFTEEELCYICENFGRDQTQICVVETPRDLMAIENTREYRGLYHVLHGAISPLDGISPNDIKIEELLKRVEDLPIKEVIIATNPTVEGEATAIYISRLLSEHKVEVTRIAHGIPMGGDLEYSDEITLAKSLLGRRKI